MTGYYSQPLIVMIMMMMMMIMIMMMTRVQKTGDYSQPLIVMIMMMMIMIEMLTSQVHWPASCSCAPVMMMPHSCRS